MQISVSTFIATLIFGALMIIMLAILLRCTITYGYMGLYFLMMLAWIILIRLLLPVEILSFTITIPSDTVMPVVRDGLDYVFFKCNGYPVTLSKIVLFVWGIGIFFYNYHLYKGYRHVCNLLKLPNSNSVAAEEILRKIKAERHIKNDIRLIQNKYVSTPSLVGILKPVIMLPTESLSDDELYLILNHELSHYQSKDNLAKFFMEIINSIYWWNPLFYVLKHQLSTIFEFKADANVIQKRSVNCRLYMECLLKLYKRQFLRNTSSMVTAFCATNNRNLVRRFRFLEQLQGKHQEHFILVLLACMCIFLCSFSVVFEAVYPLNDDSVYEINDSACLIEDGQGHYTLYIDGDNIGEVSNIYSEEIRDLPIYHVIHHVRD